MAAGDCKACGGDGVVWIDYGYDLGYGFPDERRETCRACDGTGKKDYVRIGHRIVRWFRKLLKGTA